MVGRAVKQRPPVAAEVELANALLAGAILRPDQEERGTGHVLPAEHGIAAQRAEREVGIANVEGSRRSRAIRIDPIRATIGSYNFLHGADVLPVNQLVSG